MANKRYWTIGQLAVHFGVEEWKVRRLFERSLLPEPSRLGSYRVIEDVDLPRVSKALEKAGYMKAAK